MDWRQAVGVAGYAAATRSKLVACADLGRRLVPIGPDRPVEGLVGLLLEICVADFTANQPVVGDGVLDAAADGPSGLGLAGPDTGGAQPGIGEGNAAGSVKQDVV